jgi:uncharacterized membrane protein
MDFLTFLAFVCLIALLIYVRRIESRRSHDAREISNYIAALTSRIHALEQQVKQQSTSAPPAAPVMKPATSPVAHVPISEPKPAAPAPQPPKPVPPLPPAVAVPSPPKAPTAGGAPLTSPAHPPQAVQPPIAAAAAANAAPSKPQIAPATPLPPKPAPVPQPSATAASHAVRPLIPGMVKPVQGLSPATPVERVPFSSGPYAEAQAPKKEKRAFSLEETLGRNWFPKVGIALIVIGMAFLMRVVWGNLSPVVRVGIIYAAGVGILAGGIFLERKERYRNLGRALIGGGWAIAFAISYAITHVQAVQVLASKPVDLFLLLTVAGAMVWHTLKYNSQTVTGIAFLLGFVSVTLNPDPPYNLIAAAVLVSGLTVIVLRRQWYELEVFGILASYLNHFYWIYQIFQESGRKPFPQYWSSVALMIAYWTIFRASYLLRKIAGKEQEKVSTVAALLSPLLFLGVMKYQSFHPEWAFWALLIMGAVEFTLGQLPVARRRLTPFQILSSLGATLMVVAIPSKYAGHHSLELLWMAGAEAFLLAGIFTRERLFRQYAGIISFLVAFYLFGWPPNGIIYQAGYIFSGQRHHDPQLAIVLGVVAVLLYVNSHVLCRIWHVLFDRPVEKQAAVGLSFAASFFAAGAIYVSAPNSAVAVWLAVLVTALAWTARRFRIPEMLYQAHWIALVAIVEVSVTGIHLDATWHSLPQRLITFGLVAGLVYVSSNFVRLAETVLYPELAVLLYRWAGTGLIALLIWLQIWFGIPRRDWLIAVLWTALALALSTLAQFLKRSELNWQAFTLAMMSFCTAFVLNFEFEGEFHRLSYRLISVTFVSCGIYLLARWAPMVEARPAYSWAGTILLGYLAFKETQTQQPWTAVLWVGMAAVLALAARWWKDRALLWQTHLLAAAATTWTIFSFLSRPEFNRTSIQLITVLIKVAVLYGLTWLTRVSQLTEDAHIWQAYSWAGSLLLSWLGWYQLQPINLSLAWGFFGLVLFEIGYNSRSSYLRAQAYVALISSFAHLFYTNFPTPLEVGKFDPRILLIVLLVPMYFWTYWRLHEKTESAVATDKKLRIEYLLACLGTATVAALAYFEMPAEAIVAGYAAIVLALLIISWWTRLQIFLYQMLVMLGICAFRLSMRNFRDLRGSFVSALPASLWAIGLLAVSIPIALRLRSKDEQPSTTRMWITFLARRPEQPLFFVTVVLMSALLAIKLPDMLTLAWGIEGVLVYVLALIAKERSFRLTGFALVVICSVKIAGWDAWRMSDPRARYLTFIGLGIVILLVSYLYARYREALREYL